MANEGIELHAYSYSDPTNLIDIIPLRIAPGALEELDKVGAGKVTLPDNARNTAATEYRNYIKVLVDGVTRAGFVVQEKKPTIITKGEFSGKATVVSGEGPMTWFNDAVILPELGLKDGSFDTRVFNFATARGPWYQASDWSPAVEVVKQGKSTHQWSEAPSDFPDNTNASWIWSVHHTTQAPAGYNYFRREFTTTASGSYKIFIAADDLFEAFIDGQKIVVGDDKDSSWRETRTVSFDLDSGNHVFGARVKNTGGLGGITPGPAGLLMAMYQVTETNGTAVQKLVFTTAVQGWSAATYGKTPGWTAGDLLIKLQQEAFARDVKFASFLGRTFTNTHDSNGVAWKRELAWEFKVGTDNFMTAVEKVQESGVSIWIDPDTLQFNAVQTRGADKSTGDNTVVLYEGKNLTKATADERAEIKNNLYVRTQDGWNVQSDTTSVTKYGRIEGKMEFDLPTSESAKYTTEFLKLRAKPEESAEYELIAQPNATPWVDFVVGDWVRVDTSVGTQKRRVVSISASEDDETGYVLYTVEFDTIFLTKEQELQKKIEHLTKDVGLGNLTTSSKVTVGTPSQGGGKFVVNPLPVTNLTGEAVGYWSDTGRPYTEMKLSWTAPFTNDDGSVAEGLQYEIHGVREFGSPTSYAGRFFTTVDQTFASLFNLNPREKWQFKVRTINLAGKTSPFVSLPYQTLPYPLQKLDPPTKPVLSSKLGLVLATWDGKLAQGANTVTPPYHLESVVAFWSTTENGTYTRLGTAMPYAGDIVLPGLTRGSTVWVKLKAIDTIGNESPFSASASIKVDNAVQDTLDEALENVNEAIEALEGDIATVSGSVITSGRAPTAADGQGKRVDTFWYQIIDGVLKDTWRWTGTAWEPMEWGNVSQIELEQLSDALQLKLETMVTDTGIAKQDASAANGRVTSSPNVPKLADGTNKPSGAMWYQFDTQGNILGTWRWTGSAWDKLAISKDALAASINSDIQKAVTDSGTANSKVTTSANVPTVGDGAGKVTGAIWYRNVGGETVATYTWNGSAWQEQKVAAGSLAASVAASIKAADDKAAAAGTTADTAIGNAKTANEKALEAANIANNKGKVIFGTATPAVEDRLVNNLWIDQNPINGVAANTPKRWNGNEWVAVTDKVAIDAANAAATAKGIADQAVIDAGKAQTKADLADGRVTTSTAVPTTAQGTGKPTGAVWYRFNSSNELIASYRWTGTAWEEMKISGTNLAQAIHDTIKAADDKGVNAAKDAAAAAAKAQSLMDSAQNRISDPSFSGGEYPSSGTWYVDTASGAGRTDSFAIRNNAGTGADSLALIRNLAGGVRTIPVEQDQVWELSGWYRTTSNWNGTAGNSKLRLATQTSAPVSLNLPITAATTTWKYVTGRYKVPSSVNGLQLTVVSDNTAGSVWWDDISFKEITLAAKAEEDARLAKKAADDNAVTAELNGKKSTVSTSTPPTSAADYPDGAIWYQVNGSRDVIGMWSKAIGGGGTWVSGVVTNEVIGNLTAGKITTGTLSADRIGASSITVDKLIIGNFTNLIEDPLFFRTVEEQWVRVVGDLDRWTIGVPSSIESNAIRITGNGTQQRIRNRNRIAVRTGAKYAASVRYYNQTNAPAKLSIVWRDRNLVHKGSTVVDIPTGGWLPVSMISDAAPENSVYADFELELTSASTSGQLWVAEPEWRQAVDGTVIENGAITTGHIKTGALDADTGIIRTLDAGKITVGFMEGDRIKANTISSKQMMVGDFEDLFEDASLANPAAWAGLFSIIPRSSPNQGANMMVLTGAASVRDVYSTKIVNVVGGEKIAVSAQVYSGGNVAGTVWLFARVMNMAGTWTYPVGSRLAVNIPSASGTTPLNGVLEIPANSTKIQLGLSLRENFTTGAVSNWHTLSAKFQKGGTLIEDGAITTTKITVDGIDAKVMTTGTLDAGRIAANSISTRQLLVGNFDNLLEDPSLTIADLSRAWVTPTGTISDWTRVSNTGSVGVPAKSIRGTGTGEAKRFANKARVSAFEGEYFSVSGRVVQNLTGPGSAASSQLQVGVIYRKANGEYIKPTYYNIPAGGGWKDFAEKIGPAPVDTEMVDFEISVPAGATGGAFQIGNLAFRRGIGATVIEDGAVTTNHIKAGTFTATSGVIESLDAAVITAGFIKPAVIEAGSIGADKLVITNFTNLIEDPLFDKPIAEQWVPTEGTLASWVIMLPASVTAKALRVTPTSSAQRLRNRNRIAVRTGAKYALSARVSNQTNGVVYLRITWRNVGTGIVSSSKTAISVGSAWRDITFITDPAPESAVWADFEFEIPATVTSGFAYFAEPEWRQSVGATVIENGTITTNMISSDKINANVLVAKSITGPLMDDGAVGTVQIADLAVTGLKTKDLDAAKITVGFLDAARIQANTVTADKILVGDFRNYIPDAGFESISSNDNPANHATPPNGVWYKRSGASTASTTVNTTGGPGRAWKLDGVGTEVSVFTTGVSRQRVDGGAKYLFSGRYQSTLTGTGTVGTRVRFYTYTDTGAATTPPFTEWVLTPSSWTDIVPEFGGVEVTMPNTARYMRVMFINGNNNTGGSTWIVNPSLKARTSTALIENDAITVDKIFATKEMTAKILNADNITAATIVTGQINSLHTITGPLIQTIATANRGIKLDAQGLTAYNASGVNTFNVSALTGNVNITGSFFSAPPGGGRLMIFNSTDYNAGAISFASSTGDRQGIIYSAPDSDLPGRNRIAIDTFSNSGDTITNVTLGNYMMFRRNFGNFTGISTGVDMHQNHAEMYLCRPTTGGVSNAYVQRIRIGRNGDWQIGNSLSGQSCLYALEGTNSSVFLQRGDTHYVNLHSNGWTYFLANTGFSFDNRVILNGTNSYLSVGGNLTVGGAKNFIMPHPEKEGHMLKHASTEAPYNGVEYWSQETETIPASGELSVELPSYFEALTKSTGRAVILSAGSANADLWHEGIVDGSFIVHGTPGAKFDWNVKAVRQIVKENRDTLEFEVEYVEEEDDTEASATAPVLPAASDTSSPEEPTTSERE